MKQFYTLLALCCLFQFTVNGQCSDLFFSEYIEGSSNNKAIEIYNQTDNPINLGAYTVNLYSNGSVTPNATNSITLPDNVTLGAGEVYVISHASAAASILAEADFLGGPANFNGDDALELADTNGNSIDIIGVIGEREEWEVGSGTTKDHTLVRNSNINDGETDWSIGALGWDVYDQNFIDSLGAHSINSCDVVAIPPAVSFASISGNVVERDGASNIKVNVSNLTEDVSFEISLDGSSTASVADGSANNLANYSFTEGGNDTSVTVTFNIINDNMVEGDETFVLKLINVTSGVTVSSDTYTLVVFDDDVELNSACSNLFFSEYMEGSGNNKSVEVFNPTDEAIDLGDYKINRYNGGVTAPTDTLYLPSGFMLAAGDVYVIANDSGDPDILAQADTLDDLTFYNGDDALELVQESNSTAIDIIGRIGEDPGTNWPVDTGATSEYTLVRKSTVHEGYTNWAASSATWDVYARDSFAFIGNHTIMPCDTTPAPCMDVTITITGNVTDESIDGADDGAIDASASGGAMPYDFLWDNGEVTEDISNLEDGEYCLTVTDTNGCSAIKCFDVVRGVGPCDTTNISIILDSIKHESVLNAEDGAINITVEGGTTPYTYNWSNGDMIEDISDLPAGNYTVIVKDSNDCEGTNTFTIIAGPDPCAGVTIVVTLEVTDESTIGANDGSIDATITGGSTPYNYSWSNGDTTKDISGLTSNDYTLIVIDKNGCRGEATATVDPATVGINEISSLKIFNVFPNPVNDLLNVELQFANTEDVQLEITDVLGRNLFTLQPEQVFSKVYSIQPNVPSGIYFLKVLVNGSIAVEPFIVR